MTTVNVSRELLKTIMESQRRKLPVPTICLAQIMQALAPEQPSEQPASRESRMVVIKRDANGLPTVWCDPEIADVVKALNDGGVITVASCSGHGHRPAVITMQDGRYMMIVEQAEWEVLERLWPTDINGQPAKAEQPGDVHPEDFCDKCGGPLQEPVAWMIEDFRSPARFSTDPRTPVMAASRPDHLCTPLYLAPPANDSRCACGQPAEFCGHCVTAVVRPNDEASPAVKKAMDRFWMGLAERGRKERDEALSAFKNFHRLLCERFGYTHDEKDWQRDQLSLIEHIAKNDEAVRLLEVARDAIGMHNAPRDCYSTGPLYGDARDAACPACRFIAQHDAFLTTHNAQEGK